MVNIWFWFWFRYEPTVATTDVKFRPSDCTVIVPTVGPKEENIIFEDMIASILVNRPARLIFSTDKADAEMDIHDVVPSIIAKIEAGTTDYQVQRGLGKSAVKTNYRVSNAKISTKRE